MSGTWRWIIYAASWIYAVVTVTVTIVREWRKVAAVRAQCDRDIAEAQRLLQHSRFGKE